MISYIIGMDRDRIASDPAPSVLEIERHAPLVRRRFWEPEP